MNLRQFEGKNVRLTDKDGEIFDGYKYENPVEFTALEIQSVEIL